MRSFTLLFVMLLCIGCTSKESGPHPEEGEGENEFDPGVYPPSEGTGGGSDGGTDEGSDGDEGADGGTDEGSDDPGDDGSDGEPEDTAAPDPDPPDDDPPDPEDTGEPDTAEPPPLGLTVCYPGVDEDYTACFPVVSAEDVTVDGYEYPEPFEGNPQYRAPAGYLDLRVSDHETGLSPNFVFSEFMSEAKGPFGFFQVHVVETLQALREASGGPLYINSGYRNVTYNEGVGGATWSRHLYGDAVDMYSGTLSLSELAEACTDLGADFTKLYSTHVHCDWRDHPLDVAFFDPIDP